MTIGGLHVAVAGGTLAAWRMGAQRTDAPVVVAVHGITATSRSWLAVADALGPDAALIAPDLRGRGASRLLPGPFGLDVHAEDLLALLDAAGLQAPVVAGHSLGAYIACRFAVRHPERVGGLVLVDGGLPIAVPQALGDERDRLVEAFLGPAVARLHTEFPDRETYRAWWAAHPALAGSDVVTAVLHAYADYDLCGEPPRLRSSVNPEVVPADGGDLFTVTDALTMDSPAVHLHAGAGLDGAPPPMQDGELVREWAAQRPDRRRAVAVPDANHYTIVMGAAGARVVAAELLAAVDPDGRPS